MKNENFKTGESKPLNKGGVISCKFLVNILPRTDGLLNFIYGWDDFIPQEFNTEGEAIEWISTREFGKYTVTKIYCL